MVTETLERRLLQIVKEQQSEDPRDGTLKGKRLLAAFREAIIPPIDVFYILSWGSEAKELFVDKVLGNPHTLYVEPHIINYEGKEVYPVPGHSLDEVISGRVSDLSPQNFALLVDDSWDIGTTAKKTIRYVENLGYESKKIFFFHYLGSCSGAGFRSERYGFVTQNPVLAGAGTMLDFFDHPWKYQ